MENRSFRCLVGDTDYQSATQSTGKVFTYKTFTLGDVFFQNSGTKNVSIRTSLDAPSELMYVKGIQLTPVF
jgi:hypothetical protein